MSDSALDVGKACFHPRSCPRCDRLGRACEHHAVGDRGHENCSGAGPWAGHSSYTGHRPTCRTYDTLDASDCTCDDDATTVWLCAGHAGSQASLIALLLDHGYVVSRGAMPCDVPGPHYNYVAQWQGWQ